MMDKSIVEALVAEYGTPLYVFDDSGFIGNYQNLCDAFRKFYPRYNPGYSYKTNYTPHICKIVKQLGGYAEVVSDMELSVARKIGYDDSNIIYNGPCKGNLLEQFILNGGVCNIDNEFEAERITQLAKDNPSIYIKVGIRINTDIGAGFISRFGVDPDSSAMDNILRMIKSQPNLSLVGVHMHVSRARYLSAWQRRIENALEVADKIIDGTPEYIDLGSGMFADMEDYLKQQFTIEVPTYEEYAEVVAGTMAKHYMNCDNPPMLITEPGTTVVSRYLSLLTTVKAFKSIQGRNIAIVDSDVHQVGETAQMMKVPYTIYNLGKGKVLEAPTDITGFTCLEQDVLYKEFSEPLSVGDIIELRNIGGYSVVYKPPFIQPNCTMVSINENKYISVIKRKETFEDIFTTFIF